MVQITFLHPIEQFNGSHRFLAELESSLQSPDFCDLKVSVAFAKSGPLLRLTPHFKQWKTQGKTSEAMFGIDFLGTSKQALEVALELFDKVYVVHSGTYSIFHPKFYLFTGPHHAACYQGSHNFTGGGTETNLEGGVKIGFDRPQDEAVYQEALSGWTSLLPGACSMTIALDAAIILNLLADGLICDETAKGSKAAPLVTPPTQPTGTNSSRATQDLFKPTYPAPPTPIPKQVFPAPPHPTPVGTAVQQPPPTNLATIPTQALVIQIVPHSNGEVFLSKMAVNQNAAFFEYPFTGVTTPKLSSNPSYPQRVPDPIVNIAVYDAAGKLALHKPAFPLNTVFYSRKAEIRITLSQDLVAAIAPYSIMVIRRTSQAHDYDIEVFNPGVPHSLVYQQYLAVCNQSLPSGGSQLPRKMGWL